MEQKLMVAGGGPAVEDGKLVVLRGEVGKRTVD
jgi:hypothetical protein